MYLSPFHFSITKKEIYLLALVWLLFGLFQSAHFYLYYSQPALLSLKWGIRDWFLWVLLSYCCFYMFNHWMVKTSQLKLLVYFTALTLFVGISQPFLVVVVDYFTDGISRPFWDDVLHLYGKRWFQNLFIFTILWMIFQILFRPQSSQAALDVSKKNEIPLNRIKISDGKQHVWLEILEIIKLEVAGNYLCYFTAQRHFVTRSTLKEAAKELAQHGFIQINRSCLVNRDYIKSCERLGASQVQLNLTDGNHVMISRRYWKKVKAVLSL